MLDFYFSRLIYISFYGGVINVSNKPYS